MANGKLLQERLCDLHGKNPTAIERVPVAFRPNYRGDRLARDRAARIRADEKRKKREEKSAKREAERPEAEDPSVDEQHLGERPTNSEVTK
jgi:hypothetical protein